MADYVILQKTEDDLDVHLRCISNCTTQCVDNVSIDYEKLLKDSEKICAVPIHQRPDLLAACADLVNSEWRRSHAARVHSLQKSCPEFPVCLVLLQGHGETERLLGHVRLSRVVGHSSSLFVESVVVSKVERGKGYGRTLMEETERYARSRGFKRLCLTTHDKQHFYAHLGYVLSTPVQNAGAMTAFIPMETLQRFSRTPGEGKDMQNQTVEKDSGGTCGGWTSSSCPPSSIAPPPPPPLSLPLPPPPPPHPHPPRSAAVSMCQTLTETPYRDAKGVPIFWMHKDM